MVTQGGIAKKFPLERLDPLSKLVALFCLAILAMRMEHPIPQAVMLLFVLVAAIAGAGMSMGRLGRRVLFIAGFGLPLFILTSISAAAGQIYLTLGPFSLTEVGLLHGAAVTLRMMVLFLSSLIYIESTDAKDFIVIMAQRLKLPYRFLFGISMALTFLPLLEAEAKITNAARKIRGGRAPRGIKERLTMGRSQLFSIFAGAIRRVQQTAGAMDAKGFGAFENRTYFRDVRIGISGYVVCFTSIFALVILLLL
ncbi:energy-coupling factor transporter transmembrane component T family protein [Paenibacillus lentus]|uniref:Energy-coupling factor transporter transmembrane protein EcfT n=1 Tax=Paenibacillus lentus TaxID=1338368 RepID=A0A3S8RPE4_9BACL|nr:energy-coupling factor transporter transmembrane component T [Paenibacillus lentus]AZK44854.1 energy-coupling factor transporter transmembrane protein EcfT [Paenibacillus lentus]